MRIKNITGLDIPPTARPGDTFTFTGELTITITGITGEMLDVTSFSRPRARMVGDIYAEIIGEWKPN